MQDNRKIFVELNREEAEFLKAILQDMVNQNQQLPQDVQLTASQKKLLEVFMSTIVSTCRSIIEKIDKGLSSSVS